MSRPLSCYIAVRFFQEDEAERLSPNVTPSKRGTSRRVPSSEKRCDDKDRWIQDGSIMDVVGLVELPQTAHGDDSQRYKSPLWHHLRLSSSSATSASHSSLYQRCQTSLLIPIQTPSYRSILRVPLIPLSPVPEVLRPTR